MQTCNLIRGMTVCVSGGKYVDRKDAENKIAAWFEQMENRERKIEEQEKMIAAFMKKTDADQVESEILHGKINALEAENKRLRAALENVLLAIDHEDYYNDAVFDEAREALKEATNES